MEDENQKLATASLNRTPTPAPDRPPGAWAYLRRQQPVNISTFANLAALAVGAIASAPTLPNVWVQGYFLALVAAVIFCVLPYGLTSLVVKLCFNRRGMRLSPAVIWLPSLLYVPVLAFAAWISGSAFVMAQRGESGSEFIPLILFAAGVYFFWVIPLIAFIINGIYFFTKKWASQETPQL